MQRYSELRVWHEAHALLLDVYRVTRNLPESERYGLSSQLRRAAVSVPTNIVEGSKRIGRPDFVRFLNLAEASLAETQYLLIVCRDLGYLAASVTDPLIGTTPRIGRMLHRLRSRITLEDIQGSDSDSPPQGRSGGSREPSALASIGASSSARAADAASSPSRATEGRADVATDELVVARSSARARKACRTRSESGFACAWSSPTPSATSRSPGCGLGDRELGGFAGARCRAWARRDDVEQPAAGGVEVR